MRIRRRALLRLTVALFFVGGTLGRVAAHASSTTILTGKFTGTIATVEPGSNIPTSVVPGLNITGNFGYDYTQTGNSTTGFYNFTSPGVINQSLSFTVATTTFGDSYAGGSFSIQLANTTSGGITTTTMDIHAVTNVIKNGSNAFIDLILVSTTYTGGLTLPRTVSALSQFVILKGSFDWDPTYTNGSGLTEEEGITSIDIVTGGIEGPTTVVPEPSSLALAVLALGTGAGAWLISRRKAETT
jgi:hypothetical protein